jgi:hypothetical protein
VVLRPVVLWPVVLRPVVLWPVVLWPVVWGSAPVWVLLRPVREILVVLLLWLPLELRLLVVGQILRSRH